MNAVRGGFSVTFIGGDGSGKSTVVKRLLESLPFRCEPLYMGVSTASSNRMLPTTRLLHVLKRRSGGLEDAGGPPDPERRAEQPSGAWRRAVKAVRGWLHVAVLISEEWYRQVLAWAYLVRGCVVLHDRHFFIDYYAYDITQPLTVAQRVHGWLLRHVYPRPELVLFLDAPPEVLFERKGEGSVALLERRRRDYFAVREQLPHFAVLDARRPLDEVKAEAEALILHYARHRGLPDGR